MKSIGITGNIGSGKSIVCQVFYHAFGIPIYDADSKAKWFMQHDNETKDVVLKMFGHQAFVNDQLNKPLIAQFIFNNPSLKTEWEQFIHHKVIQNYQDWKSKLESPYHLHESALIYEAHLEHLFDYIILVIAPEELRFGRLLKRGMQPNDIQKRMQHQIPDYVKLSTANFVIYNDEHQSLLMQAINIHNQIISKT